MNEENEIVQLSLRFTEELERRATDLGKVAYLGQSDFKEVIRKMKGLWEVRMKIPDRSLDWLGTISTYMKLHRRITSRQSEVVHDIYTSCVIKPDFL